MKVFWTNLNKFHKKRHEIKSDKWFKNKQKFSNHHFSYLMSYSLVLIVELFGFILLFKKKLITDIDEKERKTLIIIINDSNQFFIFITKYKIVLKGFFH